MRHTSFPLGFFIVGTVAAAMLAGAGLIFLNREQCPEDYTQAQVDTAGCVVGANIGPGLMLFLAAAVGASTVVITLVLWAVRRKRKIS